MSAISGTCGESLAGRLFQQGMEQQTAQRLEQQRELQQERLQRANESEPDAAVGDGRQNHNPIDLVKGGLLDTYA